MKIPKEWRKFTKNEMEPNRRSPLGGGLKTIIAWHRLDGNDPMITIDKSNNKKFPFFVWSTYSEHTNPNIFEKECKTIEEAKKEAITFMKTVRKVNP